MIVKGNEGGEYPIFTVGVCDLTYHLIRFITLKKQNHLSLIEKGGGESKSKKNAR